MSQNGYHSPEGEKITSSSFEKVGFDSPATLTDNNSEYHEITDSQGMASGNQTVVREDVSINVPQPPSVISIDEQALTDVDRIKAIEKILFQDLDAFYEDLPDTVKGVFLKKGHEAALQIQELLQKTKLNIKKVIMIISDWLKVIPGINKFFLEQEAKIRADRIIHSFQKED